jgi:uncharacterized membrane protein
VTVSERRRVTICGAIGLLVFGVAVQLVTWELAVLIGWIATASVLPVWVVTEIRGLDAESTARIATREDDSRAAALVGLVGASSASLVAVVIGLHRASSASTALQLALTVASMATIVLSWLVVHTLFVLRYAHLYYGVGGVGGIDFRGDEAPDYRDFAYLAFTIGMTYQVSDTDITSPVIRRTVLRHATLSYLFGTAIIASTISVLASLVV